MYNYQLLQDILIIVSVLSASCGSVAFLFWLLFKRGVPPYEQLNHKQSKDIPPYKTYKYKSANSL